jgi:hypothetical protein
MPEGGERVFFCRGLQARWNDPADEDIHMEINVFIARESPKPLTGLRVSLLRGGTNSA